MRETHAQLQVPAKGADDVPYIDQRSLAQGMLRHGGEMFMGIVTGAGGAGGEITGVPFEPAAIVALNPAGATPAMHYSMFSSAAAGAGHHVTASTAVAANATPPTKTMVASGNWTVGLPTAMAPDTEVLTVLIIGFKDIAGSE